MTALAHMGEMLALHARLAPEKIGAADLERKMTFRLWHSRACRLANAFSGLGLGKGDRVCVLAYNCLEWLELYAGAALAGVVVVPINFRLTGPEIRYIVENCEARVLVVQDDLLAVIESVRADLPVAAANFIHLGAASCPVGYRSMRTFSTGA
jgi:fatty-acyl-CoA synthase